PQQRAAVDANTAIAQAVQADKAAWESGSRIQPSDEYNDLVDRLFYTSEDRPWAGSEIYAPRTVAVLDALKQGSGGAWEPNEDLDNYLDMRALVSTDDLLNITPENMALIGNGQPQSEL